MACCKSVFVLALLQLHSCTEAVTRLRFRQSSQQDVSAYLLQVNAARYDIAITQAGNESGVCSNPSSETTYDGQPYDPNLAAVLICETDSGVTVFPDLQSAANNFSMAYVALQNASTGSGNSLDCADAHLDVETFDAAGINGTVLEDIICSIGPATSSLSSATTGSLTSISSVSSLYVTSSTFSASTTTLVVSLTASITSSSTEPAFTTSFVTSKINSTAVSFTTTETSTSSMSDTTTNSQTISISSSTSAQTTSELTTSNDTITTSTSAPSSTASVITTSGAESSSLPFSNSLSTTTSADSTSIIHNSMTTSTLGPSVIVGPPVSVIITTSAFLPSASMTAAANTSGYAGTVTLLNTVWIFVDPANATMDTTSTELGSVTRPLSATGTGGCVRWK